MRGLIPATVRWYVGDEVADLLGIGHSAWSGVLEGPFRHLSELVHVDVRHSRVVRSFMREVGGSAVRAFMTANRGDDRPEFTIPTELQPKLAPRSKRFRV